MDINDSYYIGVIIKKHGYKGELACVLDVDDPEKYSNMESVFLMIKGKLVPFFIEKISIRTNSNQAIIKFRDINNETKATQLIDCKVYLPLEKLPALSGDSFYFHEVEGYDVYDKKNGYIGKIDTIIDHPGNPLMRVKLDDNEILIPVRDEFICKVDRKFKKIDVTTPDGLLDIFLLDNQ